MIREQRLYIGKKLRLEESRCTDQEEGMEKTGEGADAHDIIEALALLLSFACAVEYLLQRSSNRSWRGIPELSTPIKSLIDQLLTGEDSEGAESRLLAYCKTAIAIFGETHIGVERKLDEMSLHLAEELRPAKIMKQAKVSGLSKAL
ncbi:MAG: hypothetical protein ABIK28_21100, partial [Planctomycetota bacterium]